MSARARLIPILALVMATLLLMLAMGPVTASSSYRPDARIRLWAQSFPPPSSCGPVVHYNNPWTGDNVYNTTASHQKVNESQYSGGDCFVTWQFQISIQNDGTHSDRFRVKATGPAVSSSSWKLTYMHGTTNITSQIVSGTFKTGTLSPGAAYVILAKAAYLGGQDLSRVVTVTSVGGSTKDAVAFSIVESPL